MSLGGVCSRGASEANPTPPRIKSKTKLASTGQPSSVRYTNEKVLAVPPRRQSYVSYRSFQAGVSFLSYV
jgi:hypothetical protein